MSGWTHSSSCSATNVNSQLTQKVLLQTKATLLLKMWTSLHSESVSMQIADLISPLVKHLISPHALSFGRLKGSFVLIQINNLPLLNFLWQRKIDECVEGKNSSSSSKWRQCTFIISAVMQPSFPSCTQWQRTSQMTVNETSAIQANVIFIIDSLNM